VPSRRRGLNLRTQLAIVVAVLSFLPNVLVVTIFVVPNYSRIGIFTAEVWLSLIIWLVLLALFSALVGYALSQQLLLPLSRLTRALETFTISNTGLTNLDVAPLTGDPAEITALKTAFSELLEQVETEQLRRHAFVATLMHDMKTPLVAAHYLLEMIRDNDNLSREERIELISRLLSEHENLGNLLQKLVDAYRFERDEVQLDKTEIALNKLVHTVISRLEPMIRQRGILVVCEGRAQALADAKELERALYNLLDNAVRYAKCQIRVLVEATGITIADDGPGLPAPLETLAQPFNAQPVMLGGRHYTAGTAGLGLFIARRVLEAHGGRLHVVSTGDVGTVIRLDLGQYASLVHNTPLH
jgi:signal transduction histidine kinase